MSVGGCPNCGANVRYTDSYLSNEKHAINGYGFSRAECIGTIERQGWSTTKAGERKWRVKYAKEPCGWSRGLKAKAKPKAALHSVLVPLPEVRRPWPRRHTIPNQRDASS